MGQRRFAIRLFAIVLVGVFGFGFGSAARAVIMDFNSLPPGPLLPPNAPYMEDGYTLLSDTATQIVDPTNNGSRMIAPMSGGATYTITESANQNFGIFTVDISGGPTNGSQLTFVGNKFGGGTVTSSYTLTGSPVPTIFTLNWMPNNGITLTSMLVHFPAGVVANTDTYEFTTVVPEPTCACVILPLAGLALRRRRTSSKD